jgi:1,2-dihydroxy-3-keto-5-methylthiopentene dioxygenase
MSRLQVFGEQGSLAPRLDTTDRGRITEALARVGVRFEAWEASQPVTAASEESAIVEAYRGPIERLKAEGGYESVDVVRMRPDHPERAAMRAKFLSEHTHAEDEVRFFVDGSGLFCLHIDDGVYLVTCERGDLIALPAGTKHWFDMGPSPHFVAIRLFINPSGWVARFTGDAIADRFPKHEACAPS